MHDLSAYHFQHVFLTGPKQIGKSTVIQRYLELQQCRYGGFLTVKNEAVYPGARSVHMLNTTQKKKPSEENFLFFCGKNSARLYGRYAIAPEAAPRFNEIGCSLLKPFYTDNPACVHDALCRNQKKCTGFASSVELILMDEIGPHESDAKAFHASILRCLDGSIPVLGVLQQADTSLFHEIAAHPRVHLIHVSTENRDVLPEQLIHLFSFL